MTHHFEKYCKDYQNIENYEKAKADNFIGWHCHHRLQTHTSDGKRRRTNISAAELKAFDAYYDRPANELIFMKNNKHNSIHFTGENNPMYGKHHSIEACKKNSEAHKGKKHNEESKKKMSDARKGKPKSEEHKRKIGEAQKGKKLSEKTKKKIGEANKGKLHTEEHKNKQSKAIKGRHWYNNGEISIMSFECPEGFVSGRLK